MSIRVRLGGIVLLAATLRLGRSACRWEEWAWRYSAYPGPTADALQAGDISTALTGWTGLHPPLWPLLHAATEIVLPIPALWLLGGAAAGTAGVALVASRRPLAGLLLATSPVALHYTAEINDYPLLFLFTCAIWFLREEVAEGRRHWSWLALIGSLAGWTHALGGLVAAVAAGSLGMRQGARILGAMAIASVPLVPGLQALAAEGGATAQPPFEADLVLADLARRFGPAGLLLLPLVARAIPKAKALGAGLVIPGLALLMLIGTGIAAPHQFPYLLVLIVPGAMLAAAGANGPRTRQALIGVAMVHATWALIDSGTRLQDIISDPEDRAIDHAIEQIGPGWHCPTGSPGVPECAGDALVLLSGGGGNDDDKTRTSPVLWRLPPWQRMHRLSGAPGDWHDHRRGHARQVGSHATYVFEHVRPELLDVFAAHARSWVVVYGDGPRQRFLTELQALGAPPPVPVGDDHLLVVVPDP